MQEQQMSNQQFIRVRDIQQSGERQLGIEWTDGARHSFDVVELRRKCPCAMCVDENTGKRTLKPESVSETVRPLADRFCRSLCAVHQVF